MSELRLPPVFRQQACSKVLGIGLLGGSVNRCVTDQAASLHLLHRAQGRRAGRPQVRGTGLEVDLRRKTTRFTGPVNGPVVTGSGDAE